MQSYQKYLVVFLIINLVLLFNQTIFAQQYSAVIEARIKQVEQNLGESIKTDDLPIILQERMKLYKIPGLSIAVIKDYKIDWAKGYGIADKELGNPVTTETLFQAASISKSLNSVGVLKLVQDKKVDLDADINTYLTSWKFPYDTLMGRKIITLKNLLSHTAGTSVHGFRGYANGEKIPKIVQILNGEAPANSQPVRSIFDAGIKTQYSGGGTTISQLIVIDVTKLPYDQYAQKNVLDPLGMQNSFYTIPPPAQKVSLLSTGHRGDGSPITGKYHLYPENAAASLWTNPTELARFIIEIQMAYEGKSKKVIGQELVSKMLTPVMDEAALGVFIMNKGNEKYFSHGGSNEGFRCIYFGSMEGGNGVVVMINSDNGAIMEEIVNSVATVYNWEDFYKPKIRKLVQIPDDVLDTYIGEYELNPQFKIAIMREGNSLKLQATNQPKFDIFAEDQNKFFLKVVEAEIEFIVDDSNKVTKLILHQNGQSMSALKIK